VLLLGPVLLLGTDRLVVARVVGAGADGAAPEEPDDCEHPPRAATARAAAATPASGRIT